MTASARRLATGPAAFLVAVEAFAAGAFALEPHLGRAGEYGVALMTWAILVAAARGLPPEDRARTAAVIAVATVGEIVFSSWLGLFTYRRHDIPAFVPPGHGLIYVAGLRLSTAPSIRAHHRALVRATLAAAAGWALVLARVLHRPDDLGLIGLAVLVLFLLRGRRPGLYAAIFWIAGPLELYATALGTWHWAPVAPVLGIPAANPPCAIPAGYILFDALALWVVPFLRGLRGARRVPARA